MRFSVVTVVLNDIEGLKRTFRSVSHQAYSDYEWLVLDGGSTDGTRAWLQELEFDALRWWSEADDGLYDAMNRGIERARGEYLVFLNAGDEFADDAVLGLVAAQTEPPAPPQLVFGDAVDIAEDGARLYRPARSHKALWWTMFACHQAMFYERRRIGDLRYRLSYRNAADYAFTAEFLDPDHGEGAPRVRRLQQPLCRFWLGGNSSQYRTSTIAEDFLIRERHMAIPTYLNVGLFLLHQLHTWVKSRLPWLARTVRGKKRVPDQA